MVPGGDDAVAWLTRRTQEAPKTHPRWHRSAPEWFDAAKVESRLGSV